MSSNLIGRIGVMKMIIQLGKAYISIDDFIIFVSIILLFFIIIVVFGKP